MNPFLRDKIIEVLNKSRSKALRLEMREITDEILSMPHGAFQGQQMPSKLSVGHAIQEMIDDGSLVILRDWTISEKSKAAHEQDSKSIEETSLSDHGSDNRKAVGVSTALDLQNSSSKA